MCVFIFFQINYQVCFGHESARALAHPLPPQPLASVPPHPSAARSLSFRLCNLLLLNPTYALHPTLNPGQDCLVLYLPYRQTLRDRGGGRGGIYPPPIYFHGPLTIFFFSFFCCSFGGLALSMAWSCATALVSNRIRGCGEEACMQVCAKGRFKASARPRARKETFMGRCIALRPVESTASTSSGAIRAKLMSESTATTRPASSRATPPAEPSLRTASIAACACDICDCDCDCD